MKLYSFQGKQYVIQGELAAELKVSRHDLERVTRHDPFASVHVRVLRAEPRRAFLKANGIKKAGGKIAIIERTGAELLAKKFKAKPTQMPLPYKPLNTPVTPGITIPSSTPPSTGQQRLQVITAVFRGESLAFIELDGRRCIPAVVLAKMLGYKTPSMLVSLIRREWESEFHEFTPITPGVVVPPPGDFAVLDGEKLNDFKICAKLSGATSLVRERTSQLLVLFESGVNKVLLKTHRPDGVAVREFLARDIMPKLNPSTVEPRTFFMNEQHELPKTQRLDFPAYRQNPTGTVSGLSDHGAERLHQAITLNTSFSLVDKLVHAGRIGQGTDIDLQISLVKEFGGVDILARAKALEPKKAETVTHPAPPPYVPPPKAAILPKVTVGEPWTLDTDPDAMTLAAAARELSRATGRDISTGRVKTLANDLRIHLHRGTGSRAKTSLGVPFMRSEDFLKVRRYLKENPAVFPAN